MKLIISSLETKQVHQCKCGQVGGFNGEGDLFVCSGCGKGYTKVEWGDLTTVTVPAYSIPVIMKPEEGMR